jgi:ABC-type multidrug transport system fused ATPase/permease subunit
MAKNLIPEELDALIKEYLTDGVLTDKERQVILKKAEGMGLDHDEIDLYLDAQVQKIDQATDAAVRRQKGKACPHCGAYVSQMTDKCPECGQYITPEATKELEEILDNLEEALINMKSRKDFDRNKAIVERYERKARMYYSNHPKIKTLLAEVDAEMANTEKRIKTESRNESIKSFLSSRWTWFGVLVVIFLILLVLWIRFEITVDETGMGIIVFGFPLLGGGGFALYNVAKWAAKGK